MIRSFISIAIALSALGCSYHARSAEDYRKVTRELVETRNGDIKACYDKQLVDDQAVSGTVVVSFTVKAETGQIANAKMDEVASSAPAALGECIVAALDGLVLDPPDARDGDATFRWEFAVGAAPEAQAAQ